jgi:hypothetical protein
MSEGPIVFSPDVTLLFLRTEFTHVWRRLDGNYFFDNGFNDCILRCDGGPFYFDKNNRVTKTALFFGPKVEMDDPQVKELRRNFQWYGGGSIAP